MTCLEFEISPPKGMSRDFEQTIRTSSSGADYEHALLSRGGLAIGVHVCGGQDGIRFSCAWHREDGERGGVQDVRLDLENAMTLVFVVSLVAKQCVMMGQRWVDLRCTDPACEIARSNTCSPRSRLAALGPTPCVDPSRWASEGAIRVASEMSSFWKGIIHDVRLLS